MTWYHGLMLALCAVGCYFLYDNGYMLVKSKTAVTFIGSGMGRQSYFGFQFTGCTGYCSRVLRVKEGGNYTVSLNANLSKGGVKFTVLDDKKAPLLTLTPENSRGRVHLESGRRYHIRMDFTHASGDSRASWEKE